MARLSHPASSPADKEIHARSSRSTACITMNFAKSPWKKEISVDIIMEYWTVLLGCNHAGIQDWVGVCWPRVSSSPWHGHPSLEDCTLTPGRRWYLGARLNERNTDCKSKRNQIKEIILWPVNFHRWQGRRDYWRTALHRLGIDDNDDFFYLILV